MNAAMAAALSESPSGRLVDLKRLGPEHLSLVLDEAVEAWRTEFDWDFRPSAELVRRFVQMQALNGFALIHGSTVTGYSYYVCDEGKGLAGDLYVAAAHRTEELENSLLRSVLDAMWATPGVQRIEAQLMMLSSPLGRAIPYHNKFQAYPRRFLELPIAAVTSLSGREPSGAVIWPWQENFQDDTARLIASAYQGHIDARINDQYRSPAGARRFLSNIVQFPGCGTFFGPASYAAKDSGNGSLCGVSLASLVSADVGHVTQVCVSPAHRGGGLGYEMLRRSLVALAAHGCRSVSLTVTASNRTALRLYERMGFTPRRDFAAYVWESK